LIHGFVWAMPSRRINNFPESRRGLGHATLQFLAVRSAILATAWLLVLRYSPQTSTDCEDKQANILTNKQTKYTLATTQLSG